MWTKHLLHHHLWQHAYMDPIAQAVEYEMTSDRIVAVKGVAAARVVVVLPFWRQHVVGPIVNATEGDVRTLLISFRSVVEHYIQDDLDSALVRFTNELLELVGSRPA